MALTGGRRIWNKGKVTMQKYLEDILKNRMLQQCKPPRDIIQQMLRDGLIENPKQAWRTLEKWDKKGVFDYGVSLDLGWLLDENGNPIR